MQTRDYQWLRGRQGSVFLAATYTAQASIVNFLTNAVQGEVAIVKKSDGSIFDGASAIPAGTEVYSVLMRDNVPTINAPFVVDSSTSILKVIGVTGVQQVTTVVISCGVTANCGNCINCVADPIEDYRIGIIETRTHDFVPDEINYATVANGVETVQTVVTRLVGLINDATNAYNKGGRQRVVASNPVIANAGSTTVPTTITFTLTGISNRPFTVSLGGFCVNTQTVTTEANDAVNGFDDVRQYEREGAVQDGDRYMQRAFPPMREVDGSHPTLLSTTGGLYTAFQFTIRKGFKSETYKERDFQDSEQNIYVPNGSTVATKLATLFAV